MGAWRNVDAPHPREKMNCCDWMDFRKKTMCTRLIIVISISTTVAMAAMPNTLTPGNAWRDLQSANGKFVATFSCKKTLTIKDVQSGDTRSVVFNFLWSREPLVFQEDGNFVLYGLARNGSKAAIWSSKTRGQNATMLRLQDSGDLHMYDATEKIIWTATSSLLANETPSCNDDDDEPTFHQVLVVVAIWCFSGTCLSAVIACIHFLFIHPKRQQRGVPLLIVDIERNPPLTVEAA